MLQFKSSQVNMYWGQRVIDPWDPINKCAMRARVTRVSTYIKTDQASTRSQTHPQILGFVRKHSLTIKDRGEQSNQKRNTITVYIRTRSAHTKIAESNRLSTVKNYPSPLRPWRDCRFQARIGYRQHSAPSNTCLSQLIIAYVWLRSVVSRWGTPCIVR